MGLVVVVFTIACYARLAKRFGAYHIFRAAILIQIPLMLVFPEIPRLRNSDPSASETSDGMLLAVLYTAGAVNRCVSSVTFTSSFLFINNAVSARHRGKVNGCAMTSASLFKSIGMYVCMYVDIYIRVYLGLHVTGIASLHQGHLCVPSIICASAYIYISIYM